MIKKATGYDVTKASAIIQDVLWSTVVQHGENTSIMIKVMKKIGNDAEDAEIINAVYTERGRVNSKGIMVYFPSSSLQVQKGVKARFVTEMNKALHRIK